MGKRLGASLHEDRDGEGRVVVPDRDIRYYLDLACGQIRRYGRREPTVLVALLRMLRDAATAARDDDQRSELRRQVDLVLDEAARDLVEADAESLRDAASRVHEALRGCLVESFVDRSGETRSI
jgi:uncharacterized membrane protein